MAQAERWGSTAPPEEVLHRCAADVARRLREYTQVGQAVGCEDGLLALALMRAGGGCKGGAVVLWYDLTAQSRPQALCARAWYNEETIDLHREFWHAGNHSGLTRPRHLSDFPCSMGIGTVLQKHKHKLTSLRTRVCPQGPGTTSQQQAAADAAAPATTDRQVACMSHPCSLPIPEASSMCVISSSTNPTYKGSTRSKAHPHKM